MNKVLSILKEYYPYIIIIIVVILLRSFVITPVRVSGTSMDKTLSSGDIMFLYKLASPKRDSIVVVDKEVEGNTIIKRVIGLPGETIECVEGVIYINDKKYDNKYANGDTNDFKKITLKDDEYFVLGDNRQVSQDSRVFGPVKRKYIKGTANFIIFPFNHFGLVK